MARLRSIQRRLTRFRQAEAGKRALAVEALAWLAIARLGLLVVPFPRLARLIGDFMSPDDPRVARALGRRLSCFLGASGPLLSHFLFRSPRRD
jgi:hypothetical protein